jgi:hypothetical protein
LKTKSLSRNLSRIGQTAIAYVSKYGWPVFPVCWPDATGTCACGSNHIDPKRVGKVPKVAHGLLDASADLAQICRWWSRWPQANIGMATGQVSGVVVVDTDLDYDGTAKWADLMDVNGPVHTTLEVITGSGGRHYYFNAPKTPLRSRNGGLGAGIDLRADGGYVLLPPSLHRSGSVYEWDGPGETAPLPEWLLSLWPTGGSRTDSHIAAATDPTTLPLGKRALFFVAQGAAMGQQRPEAVAAARNYLSAGYSVEDTAAALMRGFTASQQDPERLWTLVDATAIAADLASRPAPRIRDAHPERKCESSHAKAYKRNGRVYLPTMGAGI